MSDLLPADLAEGASRLPREALLDQREIDAVSGYAPSGALAAPAGARALLDQGAGPRDALPMLQVVLDRLVRSLAGDLRGLFGSEIDVTLASLEPVKYGEFIDEIVLPAQVVTFRAEAWDGEGLIAMGPDFARLALDALLGAKPGSARARVDPRPFSAIEAAILTRLADAVLCGAEQAFGEVAPVTLRRVRVESDPRLAEVAGPGDIAFVATLELRLDGRSAALALLLPSAAIDPVRSVLAQDFMGVKLGRDDLWSRHLATELWRSGIEAEAVLHETAMPLGRIFDLAVGDTLMFDMKPTDLVEVRCGGLAVTRGRIGRVEGRIAVQIVEPASRPAPIGRT